MKLHKTIAKAGAKTFFYFLFICFIIRVILFLLSFQYNTINRVIHLF